MNTIFLLTGLMVLEGCGSTPSTDKGTSDSAGTPDTPTTTPPTRTTPSGTSATGDTGDTGDTGKPTTPTGTHTGDTGSSTTTTDPIITSIDSFSVALCGTFELGHQIGYYNASTHTTASTPLELPLADFLDYHFGQTETRNRALVFSSAGQLFEIKRSDADRSELEITGEVDLGQSAVQALATNADNRVWGFSAESNSLFLSAVDYTSGTSLTLTTQPLSALTDIVGDYHVAGLTTRDERDLESTSVYASFHQHSGEPYDTPQSFVAQFDQSDDGLTAEKLWTIPAGFAPYLPPVVEQGIVHLVLVDTTRPTFDLQNSNWPRLAECRPEAASCDISTTSLFNDGVSGDALGYEATSFQFVAPDPTDSEGSVFLVGAEASFYESSFVGDYRNRTSDGTLDDARTVAEERRSLTEPGQWGEHVLHVTEVDDRGAPREATLVSRETNWLDGNMESRDIDFGPNPLQSSPAEGIPVGTSCGGFVYELGIIENIDD